MERAEIWTCRLRRPTGSEPGYHRPVLIVQSDRLNRTRLATVICAVLTGNEGLAGMPGNLVLEPEDSGLHQRSVVNVSQIVTVDRRALVRRIGKLSPELMALVDEGIRGTLSL